MEDHVLHTTQGLVNRAYVEELWELALSKIIAALRTHSVWTYFLSIWYLYLEKWVKHKTDTLLCLQSYCDNPDLVLDLKNLIVLFADTLQVCEFMFQLDILDHVRKIDARLYQSLFLAWNGCVVFSNLV